MWGKYPGRVCQKRHLLKEFICLQRFRMKIVINNPQKYNYFLHSIILPELYIGDQAMYT
jgi:hypothetical protein